MSEAAFVGKNIKTVREEQGMTQHDVYLATGISTPQLSAYENGKQMIGLVTLAKIASALKTSIDRLYYGTPSEAFLNKTEDVGETIVNCFRKLDELHVLDGVSFTTEGFSAHVAQYGPQIMRMSLSIEDFKHNEQYYPNADAYLEQLCKSVANEINAEKNRL